MAKDIFDLIREIRDTRRPFAVATVVETRGSASAKTSSKAVIDEEGRMVAGWVGGGCAESAVCDEAVECIQSGKPAIREIDLDGEAVGAGMPCGGHMWVYVEPVLPRPVLWIMGHGRVAECLCQMGDLVGLDLVVNDPDLDRERYRQAASLITDDPDYKELRPEAGDFVVIATQHKGDHESMKRALSSDAGYIALIASRKRSRLVLDYLRAEGVSEQSLARVMAPSGLDLGAKTPEEIALCVISEIVLVRRGGTGMRMRDKPHPDARQATLKTVGS